MRTYLECFPCLLRQSLTAAQHVTTDLARQRAVLEAVSEQIPHMDLNATPADNGNTVHQITRQVLDSDDPFREVKQTSNRICLDVLPHYRQVVAESPDPLLAALRLAAAANAIDVGPSFGHTYDVAVALDRILEGRFDFDDYSAFRQQLDATDRVLYLADNAGEIVFDRLVIEQLAELGKAVTLVVRGGAILNDATMEDADVAGIHEFADVIASGQRGPGTSLRLANPRFEERIRNAPLILSKGQGNYEGLSGESLRIFFLFRVKCHVVAQHACAPMGTIVLRSGSKPTHQDQDRHPGQELDRRHNQGETHKEASGIATSTRMPATDTRTISAQ